MWKTTFNRPSVRRKGSKCDFHLFSLQKCGAQNIHMETSARVLYPPSTNQLATARARASSVSHVPNERLDAEFSHSFVPAWPVCFHLNELLSAIFAARQIECQYTLRSAASNYHRIRQPETEWEICKLYGSRLAHIFASEPIWQVCALLLLLFQFICFGFSFSALYFQSTD